MAEFTVPPAMVEAGYHAALNAPPCAHFEGDPEREGFATCLDDGAVTKYRGYASDPDTIEWDRGSGWTGRGNRRAVVTAAAETLIDAGLARVGPVARWTDSRPLLLTDAGRERLGGGS